MAKPKAPLFGFGASGKLGDALVYSRWKGIDTAREYVVPANPKSAAQTTQRGYFTQGVTNWHLLMDDPLLTAIDPAAWNRYAGVLGGMSGFNAFVKVWVDQRRLGGTPLGFWYAAAVTDTLATSFDATVRLKNAAAQNATFKWSNSKTFFPNQNAAAMAGGVRTIAALNTGYPAGTNMFWFLEYGTAGVDYARSGLYMTKLT